MKLRMLTVFCTVLFMTSGIWAQGLSGTFQLTGVHVQYYDVARDSGDAAADVGSTRDLVLSWPSAAAPAFQYTVQEYEVGDTIAAPATPDELLTPEGLLAYGISLTVTFNSDGSFQIPTSTYPTTLTDLDNCSTYAYIPTIEDQGWYEWDGDDDRGQFGIVESNIFDLFSADSTLLNHGWLTVNRNAAGEITDMLIEWDATDGNDSQSGIEEGTGYLNRQMGITTLPADMEFVAGLNSAYGLSLPVGTFPTAGENWAYDGDTLTANWMYLFDPAGPDGVLFNDDEPLQFTSYYFTYNLMLAVATLTDAFESYYDGTNLPDAVAYAVNAVLVTFGCPTDIASSASALAYDIVVALMASGMSLEEALQGGLIYSVAAAIEQAGGAWEFPDDSDHDYNTTDGNGRLVFEMGNQCVPNLQRRVVTAYFVNVGVAVKEESDIIPSSYALHQNYPNPFNPSTTIAFDLPESGDVSATVWNILGEMVRTLHSGYLEQGRYTVEFDGRDDSGTSLTSGIYFYRIEAADFTATKKMVLVK